MAAIAVITGALALGACGGDDETPTSTAPATAPPTGTATTEQTATTTTTTPTTGGETPTAPKSATIPSDGAPDSGISDRPGGPGDGGGGD